MKHIYERRSNRQDGAFALWAHPSVASKSLWLLVHAANWKVHRCIKHVRTSVRSNFRVSSRLLATVVP